MFRRVTRPLLLAAVLSVPALASAAQPVIDVYKRATCGCCKEWITHLQANGFTVRAHDVDDPGVVRQKGKIADEHASCHTATVGGYTVEGHVPAKEIARLLSEKPTAAGLAVPGMPLGSPGMEGPRRDAYDVLLVNGGRTTVWQRYR